jgi:hypothetical protein
VELDGTQERMIAPRLSERAREKRVTAVKAYPDGKILIEAIDCSRGNTGRVSARSAFGAGTVNQTARELSGRRDAR